MTKLPHPIGKTMNENLLGVSDSALICPDADSVRALAVAMIAQSERSIDIYSQTLEALIYDQPDYCETLENMLLARRHARVRILVRDAVTVARRGHALVRLGQRLSSFISFRSPPENVPAINEDFMLVDAIGVIHWPYPDSPKAHTNFCDPAQARALGNVFQRLWDVSEASPHLRALML
jgi:hypothetical protein